VLPGNSITGSAACCARAASGHVAAVPPSSVMKSRRSLDHLVGDGEQLVRHRQARYCDDHPIVVVTRR
jgi:hypothetical protein